MGLNVGGIYLRVTKGVTQESALLAVEQYWLNLGATPTKDDALSFEPLSLEKNGRLAYLVAPAESDGEEKGKWIAIYDSERYRADPALALHLAKHFDTDVWFYEMTDSVNQGYAKRYGKKEQVIKNAGKVEEVIAPMPYAFLYFNKVRDDLAAKEIKRFKFLAFEKIPNRPKAKYSGPSAAQLESNSLVVRAQQFAATRDAKALLALIEDHQVLYDVITPAIDHADLKKPVDAKFVNALAAAVLEKSSSHCREEIAEAALRVGDEKIFERAMTMKLPSYMASLLEARATNLGNAGEPLIAFRLLEAVTRSPAASQTSWNNALYFLLKVFRDPGVPKQRIDALLSGANKNGPTNAFIFHNLACALVMLGRNEEAVEAIQNASKYGYSHMDLIRNDMDLAPIKSDARFAAVFEAPAAVTSIAHLEVVRNKHKLLFPAVGLHLQFEGLGAAPAIADVVVDLQNEFPAMFTYYRRSGYMALEATKKGKVTRYINELKNKKPKYGFEIQYDAAQGEACDQRLEIELSEKWGGMLMIQLPLALADDPDALFDRFVRYASALPFTCGHAGFSLTTYEVGRVVGAGTDAEAELMRVAANYFGLSLTAHQVGEMTNAKFLAPGWLTFLGSDMAKNAGKKIASAIAPAVVRDLKKNGMVIRAAQKPFVAPLSAPHDLGAFPAVLRALDKILDRKAKGEYAALEIERWKRVSALDS